MSFDDDARALADSQRAIHDTVQRMYRVEGWQGHARGRMGDCPHRLCIAARKINAAPSPPAQGEAVALARELNDYFAECGIFSTYPNEQELRIKALCEAILSAPGDLVQEAP